ncbi:hypothetical protein WR25_16667 [Diploscapter pachys]|uniref:Ground-like domain-containing protein n=1 Tax=Diploscapter pachys TaxID=2018661 RepID=A0A2A2KDF2_9BILA|nr:hypothetical protein WR25_16667 [Diploscapter pachys]
MIFFPTMGGGSSCCCGCSQPQPSYAGSAPSSSSYGVSGPAPYSSGPQVQVSASSYSPQGPPPSNVQYNQNPPGTSYQADEVLQSSSSLSNSDKLISEPESTRVFRANQVDTQLPIQESTASPLSFNDQFDLAKTGFTYLVSTTEHCEAQRGNVICFIYKRNLE